MEEIKLEEIVGEPVKVPNEDQAKVLEELKTFYNDSPTNHMALLEGAAGTGKTFTVTEFIKFVNDRNAFTSVAMVAPTWKAVKVIKEMCPPLLRDGITFTSLHSLLGMEHRITKDGKEEFVRNSKKPSKLPLYDLVIVDEASMVADQLFKEMESQNFRGVKILFVGDSNQINPVNHSHSIPMLEKERETYKILHFQLTKIVRQAEGNPIIGVSRSILDKSFSMSIGEKNMVDSTGVVMLNRGDANTLGKLFTHYFCSEEFDKNANHCKILAWRNATVDHYNKIIRKMKYGTAGKIVLNEKLIVDKPIKDEMGLVLFNTNEDLVVLDVEVKEKTLYGEKYKIYSANVIGDEDKAHVIHILHERSEKTYMKKQEELAHAAKNETNISTRVSKWKTFFAFTENFAQVNYNYGITTHCSQGSTYTNCFVDFSDIGLNRKEEERNRILYTAFTRSREMLYIL